MTPKEWAEQYAAGRRDAEQYIKKYGDRVKYEEYNDRKMLAPYQQGYNDRMDCPEGK